MRAPPSARAWAYIDWEPGRPAYLAIARSDQAVERIPLTEAGLLDLIAQAATALRSAPRSRLSSGGSEAEALPHFIGAFGE